MVSRSSATPSAPKIAALMACHNRKAMTLAILEQLHTIAIPFALEIFLFDDASSDGTGDAVRTRFPAVRIIAGDGNGFWNGGMYQAWIAALKGSHDGYLWLNDDVTLDGDALVRLGAVWDELHSQGEAFVVAAPVRSEEGALNYGGQMRVRSPLALKMRLVPETQTLERIDTFNGNVVLISQGAVDRAGIIDPAFFHGCGDTDYGLRANKFGVPVYVAPGTFGMCPSNPGAPFAQGTFWQRLRGVNRHSGLPVGNWLRMTWRWSGIWMPLHFLLPYRRLFTGRR